MTWRARKLTGEELGRRPYFGTGTNGESFRVASNYHPCDMSPERGCVIRYCGSRVEEIPQIFWDGQARIVTGHKPTAIMLGRCTRCGAQTEQVRFRAGAEP